MKPSHQKILTGLVILQAGFILGLLADALRPAMPVGAAQAQLIPDPAAQQMQTNEILRSIDAKLGKISGTLDAGIKVTPTEKK